MGLLNVFPYYLVANKGITQIEQLKGKRLAISRFGSLQVQPPSAPKGKFGKDAFCVNLEDKTYLELTEAGFCGKSDPEQALYGAAFYLRSMLDRFGSYPLALAAYNAGPGAVEQLLGDRNVLHTFRGFQDDLRPLNLGMGQASR